MWPSNQSVCATERSARARGANLWRSTKRIIFWGALAMAITAGVGALFGELMAV